MTGHSAFIPTRLTRTLAVTLLTSLVVPAGAQQAPPAAAAQKPPAAPAAQKAPAAKPAKDPFTLGRELFQAGKLDPALVQFQRAVVEEPNDPLVHSWLGFLLFKKGRYDDAIKSLTRSIRLGPRNPDTYNNLGNAHLAKGSIDAAIEAYRQAVELIKDKPGKNADPYYNLGNALVKRGELDQALAAFPEAEKQDPDDPLIQNNLGFVYERKHSREGTAALLNSAVEHYSRAVAKQPENAVFQRNLGLAARKQEGKLDVALLALKKAILLDPKDYNSQIALAEEYQNAKQLVQAVAAYRSAINLRPEEFVPRYNLGLLYARQAKDAPNANLRQAGYGNALAQLQAAVKLRATDHRALAALGWVHFQLGRLDDASTWYARAIQSAPEGPDAQAAHANLGLVLDRLGETEKAITHWKQALKLDPADTATRTVLASAYLSKSLYNDAVAEYREILKLDPKDARTHNNLGFCLEKLGKVDEAVASYKQAIELDPRLAIAHNNLGALYERQGQKELAKEYYQKAHQIDPSFEDAKKNLQRLGG